MNRAGDGRAGCGCGGQFACSVSTLFTWIRAQVTLRSSSG
jgi:hypothetical protein